MDNQKARYNNLKQRYGRYEVLTPLKNGPFWLKLATVTKNLELWGQKWWHSKIQTILNNLEKYWVSTLKIELLAGFQSQTIQLGDFNENEFNENEFTF